MLAGRHLGGPSFLRAGAENINLQLKAARGGDNVVKTHFQHQAGGAELGETANLPLEIPNLPGKCSNQQPALPAHLSKHPGKAAEREAGRQEGSPCQLEPASPVRANFLPQGTAGDLS